MEIKNEEEGLIMDYIFSTNLYDIRIERNITQAKMAKDLGISRRAISKIEKGEQNPSLDMAYRIAAYYNLSVQDVFPVNGEKCRILPLFSSEKV